MHATPPSVAPLPRRPTAADHSPDTVQSQQVLRSQACASAVACDRERIAAGLYDSVIHRLFAAGLQLQSTCQTVDTSTQGRLQTTIALLDDSIAELRKAIFSLH